MTRSEATLKRGGTCPLVTCEHGGNEIPAELQPYFDGTYGRRMLDSHRGWDPGSLQAARSIAAELSAALHFATVSRLVVDLNRSLDNEELFSRFTQSLNEAAREELLAAYYHPYRDRVTQAIDQTIDGGQRVVHLSVHTFTSRFRGTVRDLDVGLLFDPGRVGELRLAGAWQRRLVELAPKLRVAANKPYLGTADGFTTHLRRCYLDDHYVGIELELNNRIRSRSEDSRQRLLKLICDAFGEAFQEEFREG